MPMCYLVRFGPWICLYSVCCIEPVKNKEERGPIPSLF